MHNNVLHFARVTSSCNLNLYSFKRISEPWSFVDDQNSFILKLSYKHRACQ
jgi:hypothetical protein